MVAVIRGPLLSIEYADDAAMVEHIVSWIPESLSFLYAGRSEEEARVIRERLHEHMVNYVRANLPERAHELFADFERLLTKALQQEARTHAMRQEVGDRVSIDDVERYERDALRAEVESLPRRLVRKPSGRPRARGGKDISNERERLQAELDVRKRDRKAMGLRASNAAVLPDIARDRNTSLAALDRILYPRRDKTAG